PHTGEGPEARGGPRRAAGRRLRGRVRAARAEDRAAGRRPARGLRGRGRRGSRGVLLGHEAAEGRRRGQAAAQAVETEPDEGGGAKEVRGEGAVAPDLADVPRDAQERLLEEVLRPRPVADEADENPERLRRLAVVQPREPVCGRFQGIASSLETNGAGPGEGD